MAKVRLKNLTKKYGNVVAVSNVNLEVEDKKFLTLLGPSGCGKTTTLRCVAGLETPEDGEIYIGEDLVNGLPPKERDIAMVFQSYALYPHMTVFDNIAFPLKMCRKFSKQEIEKKVKRTADLLKIQDLLARKPKQLSGGQAQRVALGRAIVRDPKVYLMDEPLSNLDAKLRTYMRMELKKLQNDLGVTMIYVTHDQTEAMTMADKICIMNKGVIQQLASPKEIYDRPSNLFVAGFIGSPPMNFIDCTLKERSGSFVLDAGNFAVAIPSAFTEAVKETTHGSELLLGVRPEDVLLEKKKSPETFFEGTVFVTEPLGAEVIVDLSIGEHVLRAKTTSRLPVIAGEKLWIGFRTENLHLFDKKTETALF